MNPSKWKVTSNYVGGDRMYAVYRMRDVNEVDHSGNREYAGGWTENREAAEVVADQMNCYIENKGEEGQALNYETVTIDDCLDNWSRKDNGVILKHGQVTGFEKD